LKTAAFAKIELQQYRNTTRDKGSWKTVGTIVPA
jgi:hypothetical protein